MVPKKKIFFFYFFLKVVYIFIGIYLFLPSYLIDLCTIVQSSFLIHFISVKLVIMFLLSFLILVIRGLFFIFMVSSAKVCQFCWSFQRPRVWFPWFFFIYFIYFHSSLHSAFFRLSLLLFYHCLKGEVRLWIWNHSSFKNTGLKLLVIMLFGVLLPSFLFNSFSNFPSDFFFDPLII